MKILISKLPERDVTAVLGSIIGITLLSWWYISTLDMEMPANLNKAVMQRQTWDNSYFVKMFLMWAIMMIGMMLPSVIPTVLLYMAIFRKSISQDEPIAPTGAFIAGYMLMWAMFSLLATIAQYSLEQARLMSPMMSINNNVLGGSLLLVAGLYQWLPIKNRCLDNCRSPIKFISSHWRNGFKGAILMGIEHGLFCVGCCWAIMILLFVGGVMNLLWIAAITLFVFLEKLLPLGDIGGRIFGLMLIASSFLILFVEA